MSNILDILTGIVTNKVKEFRFYSEIATVISVDEDNMECDVSFISSNADKTVRLGATISEDDTALTNSSVLLLPKVDSNVIVTFINETTGFVSSVTNVSKILHKVGDRYIQIESDFIEVGGDTDFMVRYSELESAFNQLKSDFDDLVGDYNSHQHTYITPLHPSSPGSTTGSQGGSTSSADISGAKIDEIKTI